MNRAHTRLLTAFIAFVFALSVQAADVKYDDSLFSGLELRGIGPALTSGRIGDIAVDPRDTRTWYVAVASGGVWKTTNAGTTFTPIFDDQGSYSIGCVTIDPNNSLTIWVGIGREQQPALGGLRRRRLQVDRRRQVVEERRPRRSPSTSARSSSIRATRTSSTSPRRDRSGKPGGDRGLYKTTDGGKTWKAVLTISENTGVTDVVLDPRNPDVALRRGLSAPPPRLHAHQRRPGIGDPQVDRRRRDVDEARAAACRRNRWAASAWRSRRATPDTVYAIIEATRKTGGFFRSHGRRRELGEDELLRPAAARSTTRRSSSIRTTPTASTRWTSTCSVTDDGGKTFRRVERDTNKHVDNHVDLDRSARTAIICLIGCDGGLYETCDRGANVGVQGEPPDHAVLPHQRRRRAAVLPRVRRHAGQLQPRRPVAHDAPRTASRNDDWYVTLGGDGFRTHRRSEATRTSSTPSRSTAASMRFDKRTGEALDIQPQPDRRDGSAAAELGLAAHHQPARQQPPLLRARSTSSAATTAATPGSRSAAISRASIDRNKLPVMGRVWGIDAVAKNTSTSFYGNIVSLSESPLEGRAALRRHRRRPDAGHRRRRAELAEGREVPGRAGDDVRLAPARASRTTPTPSTPRSTTTRPATSSRTLLAAPTAARPGSRSPNDLPPRGTAYVDRRRPRRSATCSSPARSSACSSRRTAARTGSSSRAACPPSPCATSGSRSGATISSSARSAAASTSSTTTARCAR